MNSIQDLIQELTKGYQEEQTQSLKNLKQEVLNMYKHTINEQLSLEGYDLNLTTHLNSNTYTRKKEIISEFGTEKYLLGISLFHTDIDKLMQKEYDSKRVKIFNQIMKKLGDSTIENISIFLNEYNGLDANIKLNDGELHIFTIVAEGHVQKAHLRVLVKKLSKK